MVQELIHHLKERSHYRKLRTRFFTSETNMARTVNCVVLNQEAEGLDAPPHPGELGQRIYTEVSKEGWRQWLEQQAMIINEYGLNSADPRAMEVIEKHLLGFLFGEGEFATMRQGFQPPPNSPHRH